MAETIGSTNSNSNITSNDKFAIIIEVVNIDELFNSLNNSSINFITEPKDMVAWGIRVAHFRDPDGNLIEIFSNLPKSE